MKISEAELIEKLAEIEHSQWTVWSKAIAEELERFGGFDYMPILPDSISILEAVAARLRRWKKLWVSYNDLSEEMKEHDRVWARKVIKLLKENEILK